ncbi:MAG: DUF4302 domain-containing protein [Bacteroidota bacterium]
MLKKYLFPVLLALLFACDDDINDLPPVEERVAVAINNLNTELTTPTDGWILEYQPNETSGFYKILMKFTPDGKVNIQTDALANEGEFSNQTIPYRIDNAQGLELILETYGFFHYLFEQEEATFGGEFEFLFDRKDGDNLVFGSISDFVNPTVLTFKPATATDLASISDSRALGELLQRSLEGVGSQIFESARFQLVLEDQGVSVFFVFDFVTRTLKAVAAGEGRTEEEIINSPNTVLLNHSSGYGFSDGNILLQEPLAFVLGSEQVVISQITLSDAVEGNISYCEGQDSDILVYSGQVLGSGNISARSGLFSGGTNFQEIVGDPYRVNPFGIFNGEGESILEEIQAVFPDVEQFQFYNGFDLGGAPFYALGFFIFDANDNAYFILREFEPLIAEGNKLTFNFTGEIFQTRELTTEEEAGFIALTDKIFENGEMYVLDFAQDGQFVLYNPCNGYEVALFN